MTEKIAISEVLADIKAGKECSLLYVRGTGKQIGTLKTIDSCISGYAYKKFTPREKRDYEEKQRRGRHVLNGTIPAIDLNSGEQLDLTIALIIGYNFKKVIH